MRRRALLILGTILSFSLAGCSFLARMLFPDYEPPKMPDGLKSVGIVTGADSFEKQLYVDAAPAGRISQLRFGQFDGKDAEELAIVGDRGALFLDTQKKEKWSVSFEWGQRFFFAPPAPQTDEVNLVDVEGDGTAEFLNRGHHLNPVILFDSHGKVRWKYDAFMKDDAAAADMDGDGKLEIAVGFGGGGGVHLLNAEGQPLWERPDGNVWRVEMLDTDGDGRPEIVHSNAGGQLTARDPTGRKLWVADPKVYVGDFSIARYGDDLQGGHILVLDENAIVLFDSQARRVATLDAPGTDRLGDAFGTTVRFPGLAPLFATVIAYPLWDRSLVYLHDDQKRLVYQEVVAERCSSILAVPEEKGERLLIGCEGKVWEYVPHRPGMAPYAKEKASHKQ